MGWWLLAEKIESEGEEGGTESLSSGTAKQRQIVGVGNSERADRRVRESLTFPRAGHAYVLILEALEPRKHGTMTDCEVGRVRSATKAWARVGEEE